jgi:hypothetical protein
LDDRCFGALQLFLEITMGRFWIIGTVCVVLGAGGCQPRRQRLEIPDKSELVLIGTSSFPENLAGRWLDDRMRWDIVIEKDGQISEVIHNMGRVTVKLGQVTNVPLRDGGEAIMQPGQWVLQYDGDSREMAISLDIDKVRFQMGSQIVEGFCRDFLYGEVSEDYSTWVAHWNTFPKYYVTAGEYDHYELPMDEHLQDMGVITFKRVPDGQVAPSAQRQDQ